MTAPLTALLPTGPTRAAFALALASTLLVGLSVPGASAAPAPGDPYQATVVKVVKQVEWQRARTDRWQKAVVDNLLLAGDTIRTGQAAKTELRYGDGSVSRIGALTSLTLTGDQKRELRLNAGKVWLHIQKGGAGMRVITPGAVAAVTGTELLVEYDPGRKLTEVTVFEGSVNVIGDIGNLVKVLGGTSTRVPFRAPAIAPIPLDRTKLETRDSLVRPLVAPSTPDSQPATPGDQSSTPADPAEPGRTDASDGGETADEPPAQPVQPAAEPTAAPAAAEPTAQTPPAPAARPVTAPDPTEKLLDPRLINGSPTRAPVRVIIE